MSHTIRTFILLALASISAACAHVRSASTPMRAWSVDTGGTQHASRCAMIVLPGMGDEPESFLRHGFDEDLRDAGLECDLVLADAHLSYYREGNVGERVALDLVQEAHARGYEQIWLVGISLGGLGVMEAVMRRPEHVDGVVLIAPFLGPEARVLSAAEGTYVDPPRRHILLHARPRIEWLATHAERGHPVPIYLAFGNNDRYSEGLRALSRLVHPTRAIVVEGRHDWATWRTAWRSVLRRMEADHLAASEVDARWTSHGR